MRGGVVPTRKITSGRLFYFDNARARFREPGTGVRRSHGLLDRDDEQTLERSGGVILWAAGFSGIGAASHWIVSR
jgi:hypothetical protein